MGGLGVGRRGGWTSTARVVWGLGDGRVGAVIPLSSPCADANGWAAAFPARRRSRTVTAEAGSSEEWRSRGVQSTPWAVGDDMTAGDDGTAQVGML